MREHFTSQALNAYLDTPGGLMLCAQHGSRQAAAALAEGEAADRAWRREKAVALAERYPGRYPTVDDAMRDIPDPAGGMGPVLTGDTDDIVTAVRRVDPTRGVRNLGGELPDGAVEGTVVSPGGRFTPADTRPPCARPGC